MENLQKLEEYLNLATANGGFKTSAQAMNAGQTLQAVVKDFQAFPVSTRLCPFQAFAQEVNRLKQFEPEGEPAPEKEKPNLKKK